MPKYEVHIPASDNSGMQMTLKVGAENWMAALKAGMQKLGEQGTVSQNVMVDIQEDNSIHITDAASGRVFRIRELSDDEAAKAQVKRSSGIHRTPAPGHLKPVGGPNKSPQSPFDANKTIPFSPAVKTELPTLPPISPSKLPPAPANAFGSAKTMLSPAVTEADTQPPPKVPSESKSPFKSSKSSPRIELDDVEELVQPIKPVTGNIGRIKSTPDLLKGRQASEEMLMDCFLRVVDLDAMKSVEDAMNFILELALEKIPCESGSVLRADGGRGDLTFLTARGPKANEVMKAKLVIPAGTGIAGFCASEGVSLALSDVKKDERFYSAISEKVKYDTKSMLCAPMMTAGRSFGCVQLINRRDAPQFNEAEVGVLAYLSHQAALFLNHSLLK
jgi:hypothetical protein